MVEDPTTKEAPAPRAPMTWGLFKALVEAQGVTDSMALGYIDWREGSDPVAEVGVGRATIE